MKRALPIILFILLIFPLVTAINIQVKEEPVRDILVHNVDGAAVFNLKIKNLGENSSFEFYNLLGFRMFPIGTTQINTGETKDIELTISPIGEFNHIGAYTLGYFIKASDGSEINRESTFKVIELKDAFEVGSGNFDFDSNSIEIYIDNKVNFDFKEINVKFDSAFFEIDEDFSINAKERKTFKIQLEKEDFKKLTAGFYTLNAEITVQEEKTNLEGVIKFNENDIITTTSKDYGLIISTQIIGKTNEGNVLSKSQTIIDKNIISRLFTTFTPEPDIVERKGLSVSYTWEKEIKPGETFEIKVKTNWLFPLSAIFFIVTIVVLTKQYSKTNLVLKKKVSFVNAKGGEFALKISVYVNAKKYIENVNIIDRLPPLVKIYEKFGHEKPTRINEKNRRIEWNFEKLEVGEIRILTYIIYSKVGVFGKFALPSTTAIYEKEGKIHEAESNKTFFISEQEGKEEEE